MKKSMKKLVALLIATAMAATLVACGGNQTTESKEEAPAAVAETEAKAADTTDTAEAPAEEKAAEGEKQTLVVWLPPQTGGETTDQEFWTEQFKPWEEANNCKVDLTIVPWGNYEEKYLTGFSSGEGPDLGYMYNEMLYDYIDLGQLEILDNYLTAEDKEEFLHLDLGQINGHQYTMPLFPGGARVLLYNADILKAAGVEVPHTWDEFAAACQAIKAYDSSIVPTASIWGGDSIGVLNVAYYPYMWQAGGSIMNYDGTVTLMDNSGAVDAAQFIYDLMYKYEVMPKESVGWTEGDLDEMFTNGKLAFYESRASKKDTFREGGQDIQYIGGLGKDNGDNWQTWVAADALIINSASDKKDLAWSLLKYIESPEVMEKVHADLANNPTLTKSEKSQLDDEQTAIYGASDHLNALPVAKNANAVMANLLSNLQLMLLGDYTPEEAIQATVDYSETLD